MTEFVIRKTVRAKPEAVFDVFTDHRGYAKLVGPIRTAELEREGDPAPNGVGAIRALHMPGATIREQVTDFDRPDHYSYRMLSGAPLRDFVSTVTFTPTEQGTEVAYSVSTVPTIPGTRLVGGYLVKLTIRLFVRKAAAQAARNG